MTLKLDIRHGLDAVTLYCFTFMKVSNLTGWMVLTGHKALLVPIESNKFVLPKDDIKHPTKLAG